MIIMKIVVKGFEYNITYIYLVLCCSNAVIVLHRAVEAVNTFSIYWTEPINPWGRAYLAKGTKDYLTNRDQDFSGHIIVNLRNC